MKRLSAAAAASAALWSPSCAAFQPPTAHQNSHVFQQPHVGSSHDVTPTQSSPPGRALSLSLHMTPPSASSTAASTMASYDEQLKRAYSAASYDAMRAGAAQRGGTGSRGGIMGGPTATTVSPRELQTTTDALNAALEELKTIREMMGSSGPGQVGAAQLPPPMQAGQQGQGLLEQQQQQQQQAQAQAQQSQQTQQQVQTQTRTPGRLQIEQPTQSAGQMVPRRPTILTNRATGSSTALGTPYKQNQNIQPLRPPTSGTNIDIDRTANPSTVDARYLPTPSQARRIAKTEGNRREATDAFGRGSAGYYGRRYGVWESAHGYGPWVGAYGSSRYGTPYEHSWQSYAGNYYYGPGYYGGYGYYNPGYMYAYGPYSYGGGPWGYGDPLVYDYGWGNYYGDGRRNAYLWGSQRNGPDYYADTVELAEGQKEMDQERGRQEYARRREWQERRMRGEHMLPPGQAQEGQQQMQMQQGQQSQQQQGQAGPPANGAGATNSYLNSMGAQNNAPQQPQQQAQQATAQATTAPKTPEKKFSYLESAERDAANSALATSQQGNANTHADSNSNGNVGTPDAPYAEAEQMPFRRGYDRYGTSYSDSRYNNPAYAPANGYWDPYFGYSNWGRYGYSYPYYGGYGGVRGGDWFSDQIRRSERERVYDAQARSRWTGYYGYYGGYGRNSWGDYTFTPAIYI